MALLALMCAATVMLLAGVIAVAVARAGPSPGLVLVGLVAVVPVLALGWVAYVSRRSEPDDVTLSIRPEPLPTRTRETVRTTTRETTRW